MSYRRRKRPAHRSQHQVPNDDEENAEVVQQAQDITSESTSDAEKAAKEQEIWDSFREEHYEGASSL